MRSSILVIFLIAIGMVGCRHSSCNRKEIKKEKLADQALQNAASKVKQETGLHPSGTIGRMLNKIGMLGLSFQCYKPTDIADGRKLLIHAINTVIETVNQDEKIHPFLSKYPFQPKNVEIQIFIYGPDRKNVPQGALSCIDAEDGILHYDIKNPNTPGFITVYQETYDQALERLNDPSLPPVPFEPDSKKKSEEELSVPQFL